MGAILFKALGVPNAFRERERLRRWLHGVARRHGQRIGQLAFVLMDDGALLELNRRHLGHEDYTDVLTFDLATGNGVSGDVLMSWDRIKENAATYGVSGQAELRRVMVHGLLHLLGHRDKTKAQQAAMRALEDGHLDKW